MRKAFHYEVRYEVQDYGVGHFGYRVTSLIRKRTPLGLYRRPLLRVLGEIERGVLCGWLFANDLEGP